MARAAGGARRWPRTRRASCCATERLAPSVADRLVSTAAGNPLALLEIPRLLSDGQRAGREPLEEPLRPGTGVERAFRRALDALGDDARRALLVAGTAHTGRLEVIEAALRESGLEVAHLAPAEAARLITVDEGEVEFRHPLLRSTAYHAASAAERRAAHAALAAAAPEGSPERAWHLAAGAVAPDEEIAAALEAAALDARGRGAHATAARDFGRAAQLTPEDEPRARRLLEAATDATRSGEADRAFALLGEAARLATDPLLAADVQRMTGHVEMRRGSPLVANELLVAEAERVRSRDPRRAAGHVPRGLGQPHDHRRHARAGGDRRARAGARHVGRPGRRAAGHHRDRRGLPRARRRRAGRAAAERVRAVPARGRPAGHRRGGRHGRPRVDLDREVRPRASGSSTGSSPRRATRAR